MNRRTYWSCTMTWMAAWLCVGVIGSPGAWATSPGAPSFTWEFQDTGFFGFFGSGGSAVALRNGKVWPVIFDGGGNIYSLFPTAGPNFGSNWHQIATNLYPVPTRLRAASSVDGRVAVVNAGGVPPGVVSTLPGGFAYLPPGTVSATFDSAGSLFTADPFDIAGVIAPPVSGPILDIAISPDGAVGVLDASMTFHELNPFLGSWQSFDLFNAQNGPFNVSPSSASLSYDAQGRPHVVGRTATALLAADFSTQTGQWSTTHVNASLGGFLDSFSFELDADGTGVVGTAYIQDGDLFYAFKDNNGAWTSSLVTSSVDVVTQVGIAFDFEDLPVISYRKNGNLFLAYDPLVVPEPAALGLLSVLSVLMCRRRTGAGGA